MTQDVVPLPSELIAFIESGLSTLVGTRSADLMPESVRGLGAKGWADRRGLSVYVPAENGRRTIENLRNNGRVAITFSRPLTHVTIQVKGEVVGIREGTAADRGAVEIYRRLFGAHLAECGLSLHVSQRMRIWPLVVIDVAVHEVFGQTPGPGAGDRLAASAARVLEG